MDATATIVIGVIGTMLGGIGLAMILGQQKLSAQMATVQAQVSHLSEGVKEFYAFRTKELERRASRNQRDTGKHP